MSQSPDELLARLRKTLNHAENPLDEADCNAAIEGVGRLLTNNFPQFSRFPTLFRAEDNSKELALISEVADLKNKVKLLEFEIFQMSQRPAKRRDAPSPDAAPTSALQLETEAPAKPPSDRKLKRAQERLQEWGVSSGDLTLLDRITRILRLERYLPQENGSVKRKPYRCLAQQNKLFMAMCDEMAEPKMSADELAACGQRLWGSNWRKEMAEYFGVEAKYISNMRPTGRIGKIYDTVPSYMSIILRRLAKPEPSRYTDEQSDEIDELLQSTREFCEQIGARPRVVEH